VRRALLLQGERATFLRLSTCLHPDGVVIITGNPAATAPAGRLLAAECWTYKPRNSHE
jgi:hypothetical protein